MPDKSPVTAGGSSAGDGRVRPLGVTTKERTSVLPDVPTMIE